MNDANKITLPPSSTFPITELPKHTCSGFNVSSPPVLKHFVKPASTKVVYTASHPVVRAHYLATHMLTTPAISVIIPMYNVEKYVGECLDSLLAQTFQNFEVIIVDDCSIDNSVAIVESYAPKFNGRLTLAHTKKNSGAGGVPRNEGLHLSRGEYIFFMDADDMLTNTALYEAFTLAKKYDADVCYYPRHYELSEDGSTAKVKGSPKYNPGDKAVLDEDLLGRINDMLAYKYRYHTWRTFSKRIFLIENDMFFPNLRISEDAVMYYALYIYAKRFLYCPDPIYLYRNNPKSALKSKRSPKQRVNFWLNPVIFGLRVLDDFLRKHEFMKEFPQYRYALLMDFALRRFDFSYESSLKLDPDAIFESIRNEYGDRLGEYDVLIPALCTALYRERKAHKEAMQSLRNFTARIDVKLVSKMDGGDFKIFSVSDDKAKLTKPDWFNKGGIGYVLTSYAGKLNFVAKALGDGKINLKLRGIDVRTPNDKSKKIPYWIDYTKLTVNGKVILDKLTPTWHDKPYRYSLDVKADEEIKIEVEWLPHRSET